jgi:hypothetical protein
MLVRICGLLASAAVHISLAVALALMTPERATDPVERSISVSVEVPEEPAASPDDFALVAEFDPPVTSNAGSQLAGTDIDFEKIAARRDGLFPFVTTDMDFLDGISEQIRVSGAALANPLASRGTATDERPPLQISEADLQQTIDRAWSRRSRWKNFAEIGGLLHAHDVNTGQVPALLRGYLDQNLLQLFCDASTPATRFWAMVENASEHIDFIEFVRVFTRDHPSSLATTELLFLMDKLAQASRDTLLLLLNTEAEQTATSTSTSTAQTLTRDIQAHYRERLHQLQLESPADIKDWYDRLRLRILSTAIATSPDGYRVSDARFLIGEIYFEQGNVTEAAAWWGNIRQDARDSYAEAYSRLLDELRWPEGVRVRQIKYVLQSVDSQWRRSSLERLRHFGRACDTY